MANGMTRRRFLITAGTTAAGALLAACQPRPPAASQAPAPTAMPVAPTTAPAVAPTAAGSGKLLKLRSYIDIVSMDPISRIGQPESDISDCVMRGLVRYAPNSYELYNDLAESINQVDATTIEFKLREGVKWDRDYGEVTTEDVRYSYERFLDPNLKVAYKDDWATLEKVEIVDKYRGKIVLKEPFAPLWKTTLPITSGDIVCMKHVESVGVEKFQTDIVGCGPYSFVDWRPKERAVVKRNPNYFGKPAAFDEIHFIPIEDDKAAEIALLAGEVDWSRIPIGSIERLKNDPNLKTWVRPSLRYRFIGFNVQSPKLEDVNVRKAIRSAIDVDAILKAAYAGQAEPGRGIVAPGLLGNWKDAPLHTRDVAKAKEYMAKAGVTSLDLRYTYQNTSEYQTWGEIAQQNLKDIGINLTLEPLERSAYSGIGSRPEGEKLELIEVNFSMQPDPSWGTMWFLCSQIPGWNYPRWCNPKFDELHFRGVTTLDDAERDKIYVQMQQLWDEDAVCVWITHSVNAYAHSPRIQPATTPHGVANVEFFAPA
jgi:peptide/nickel transport system substrate-binding protein